METHTPKARPGDPLDNSSSFSWGIFPSPRTSAPPSWPLSECGKEANADRTRDHSPNHSEGRPLIDHSRMLVERSCPWSSHWPLELGGSLGRWGRAYCESLLGLFSLPRLQVRGRVWEAHWSSDQGKPLSNQREKGGLPDGGNQEVVVPPLMRQYSERRTADMFVLPINL